MKKIIYLFLTVSLIFSSCKKEEGCKDALATNYNADAEEDDGSVYIVLQGFGNVNLHQHLVHIQLFIFSFGQLENMQWNIMTQQIQL